MRKSRLEKLAAQTESAVEEHREWVVTIKFTAKYPVTAAHLVAATLRGLKTADFGIVGFARVDAAPIEVKPAITSRGGDGPS